MLQIILMYVMMACGLVSYIASLFERDPAGKASFERQAILFYAMVAAFAAMDAAY